MRGADRAYRCSLYRGFLALLIGLFRMVAVRTRRGGSRSPLGGPAGVGGIEQCAARINLGGLSLCFLV